MSSLSPATEQAALTAGLRSKSTNSSSANLVPGRCFGGCPIIEVAQMVVSSKYHADTGRRCGRFAFKWMGAMSGPGSVVSIVNVGGLLPSPSRHYL
jgi:hypothetical protein